MLNWLKWGTGFGALQPLGIEDRAVQADAPEATPQSEGDLEVNPLGTIGRAALSSLGMEQATTLAFSLIFPFLGDHRSVSEV